MSTDSEREQRRGEKYSGFKRSGKTREREREKGGMMGEWRFLVGKRMLRAVPVCLYSPFFFLFFVSLPSPFFCYDIFR